MSVTTTATIVLSRAILGPLLTTYTPPSECSSYVGPTQAIGAAYQGQGCSTGRVHDTTTCWPSASISPTAETLYGWGFYSPGTVCPSGYTSACANQLHFNGPAPTSESISAFNFQFPLVAGESAVGCCSSGFRCSGNDLQTCVSTVTSGSYQVGYCATTGTGIDTLTSFQTIEAPGTNIIIVESPHTTLSASISTAKLYAPLFQINWQATNLPSTSTSTSSAIGSTTTPLSSSTPAPSSSGLSTGAKVAIGVATPVAILTSIGLLCFWLLRRRQRNRITAPQRASMATTFEPKELLAPQQGYLRTELNTTPRLRELEESRPELGRNGASSPEPQELGT